MVKRTTIMRCNGILMNQKICWYSDTVKMSGIRNMQIRIKQSVDTTGANQRSFLVKIENPNTVTMGSSMKRMVFIGVFQSPSIKRSSFLGHKSVSLIIPELWSVCHPNGISFLGRKRFSFCAKRCKIDERNMAKKEKRR